jgi:hypothetical protein
VQQRQQLPNSAISNVLARYSQRLGQVVWCQKITLVIGITFLGVVFSLLARIEHDGLRFVNLFLDLWLIAIVVGLGLKALRRFLIVRTLHELRDRQLLANAEWPQALPKLIALLEQVGGWPSNEPLWLWWWRTSQPILIRWLPRLQHGELGSRDCRTLRRLLGLSQLYEDLQVAILLALGTAGDKKARRVATKLLRRSSHERVREAARECLAELR